MHWIYILTGGWAAAMFAAGVGLMWAGMAWTPESDRAPRRHHDDQA